MTFFFPDAHTQIDWSQGFEFMDGELQQLTKESETGRRYTDKLIKTYRLDGTEQHVLCHIEIQNQPEDHFSSRVFTYFARIRDKFGLPVASFAILGDTRAAWKPQRHQESLFGCHLQFDFPVVKLLDYKQKLEDLEASTNPFAHVVLAHLAAQSTKQHPQRRRQEKLALTKGLYQKGYDRQDIINIYRFIDWVLTLPKTLEADFQKDLATYEGNQTMPYITSIERTGIEKGRKEGLQEGRIQERLDLVLDLLDQKLEGLPTPVKERVENLTPEQLQALSKMLLSFNAIDDLTLWLDTQ